MTYQLIVTKPFLNFGRGDVITDATKISELLLTDYKKFVTKVLVANTSKG